MYSRRKTASSRRSDAQSQGYGGFDEIVLGGKSTSQGPRQGRDFRSRGRSRFQGRSRKPRGVDHSLYIKPAKPVDEISYTPTRTFQEFEIHSHIKDALSKKGYQTPSAIQDKAIDHILQGRDIIGLANTGTGKTAAFLIPIVDGVLNKTKQKVLILAPTRELAEQIDKELKSLILGSWVFSTLVTGGQSMRRQLSMLAKTNHIIVATPGRIVDIAERGALDFGSFDTIVLDEMDFMLDMGFVDTITDILKRMPEQKHSLFFSATMKKPIETLANTILKDPIKISVVQGRTADSVEQDIVRVPKDKRKLDVLIDLLSQDNVDKVLIFDKTKAGVQWLDEELYRKGFKIASIHGDKMQSQRQRSLELFKKNKVKILIATNVAARGLDIPQVSHVINFDIPENYDDYIHRIGRAGRNGAIGYALTFVD